MTMLDVAKGLLNIEELSAEHKKIIDDYNSNVPLPRGYAVTYRDSWCAVFLTVCYKRAYGEFPLWAECGCEEMRQKFLSSSLKNPSVRLPQKGDFIFYDWDKDGWSDHVEIIEDVSPNLYFTIGGNNDDSVKRRMIEKNSDQILGFGYFFPETETETDNPTLNQIADDVILGKYGTGETRKEKLYRLIQDRVNLRLK